MVIKFWGNKILIVEIENSHGNGNFDKIHMGWRI